MRASPSEEGAALDKIHVFDTISESLRSPLRTPCVGIPSAERAVFGQGIDGSPVGRRGSEPYSAMDQRNRRVMPEYPGLVGIRRGDQKRRILNDGERPKTC